MVDSQSSVKISHTMLNKVFLALLETSLFARAIHAIPPTIVICAYYLVGRERAYTLGPPFLLS